MQVELSNSELVQVINSLRDRAEGLRASSETVLPVDAGLRNLWYKTATELVALARRICLDAGIQP